MIRYPILQKGATIGVTAPSSGVPVNLHHLLQLSCELMKQKGYQVICKDTAWQQHKAKSAPAVVRAREFQSMMTDDSIHLIFPPWGGELCIEMLEYLDFETLKDKWILGYSDTSVILLAVTLKNGLATAHGTNLIDLRGEYSDDTTSMWESLLAMKAGESFLQHSSQLYQKEWDFENPSPCVFHLTEPTSWKTVSQADVHIQGRLLGGCIDVIRHLIGTPYGNVKHFQKRFIQDEPILWYFENCELKTADLRRSLVQMKLAGWFDHCSGILFGRSPANQPVQDYTAEDVYHDLSAELMLPIVYDIDCGHVPPQVTLINGSFAEVTVKQNKGTIRQSFLP